MNSTEIESNKVMVRERAAFLYTTALEYGDFETVQSILEQAETDSVLERLLLEVNDALAHENDLLLPGEVLSLATAQMQLIQEADALRHRLQVQDIQRRSYLSKRRATRPSEGITQLLKRWSNGEEQALDELIPLVYDDLHLLARTYLRRERRGHTLQPTELVNELFLKFSEQHSMRWRNRAQFFGVAAQLMRRILVDYARAHYASKRGGDRYCVSLKNITDFGAQPDADLLALHEALKGLEEIDPDQARIVELRFFGGLTIEETAQIMRTSHATVEREWKTAKAFLKRELTRTKSST